MRLSTKILLIALYLASRAALAGEIKIGFAHCLTDGPMTAEASKSLKAMRLAVGEQNAKGGIKGNHVSLEVYDTKGDLRQSHAIAAEMTAAGIAGLVGFYACGEDLTLADEVEQLKIPTVIADASDPRLLKGKSFLFQNCINDWEEAKYIADRLIKLGKRRLIVVVNLGDLFNAEDTKHFKAYYESLGGKIVLIERVHRKFIKFSDVAGRIKTKEKEADAVLLMQTTVDLALLWLELKDAGVKIPLVSNGSILSRNIDPIIKAFKQDFNIDLYPSHFPPSIFSAKTQHFFEKFNSTFPDSPINKNDFDAMFTYDSAFVLMNALERTQSYSAEAIRSTLASTNYRGITGKISYHPNHSSTRHLIFQKIVAGETQDAY